MKRLILTCMLAVITLSILAQDRLAVLPKVEFAYMPGGRDISFMESQYMVNTNRDLAIYYVDHKISVGKFRFRSGADIKYKGFTFNVDAMVFCDKSENQASFAPRSATWNTSLTYNITSMIKIRVEHSCTHPIATDASTPVNIYDGYNMIAISYGY